MGTEPVQWSRASDRCSVRNCELGPVNVNGLIREVLSIVRGELESHQVSLQTELHEGLQPVMAEPTQLQQVLLNLIMNAIDAMSAVTDRDRVLIVKSETGEPNHVAITVEDFGIGISAATNEPHL